MYHAWQVFKGSAAVFRIQVQFIVVSVFVAALLVGCVNTLPPMDVKRVPPVTLSPSQTSNLFNPDAKPFLFDKVVATLRRGEVYAHLPNAFSNDMPGFLCNLSNRRSNTVEWDGGSAYFGSWRDELGEVFFDTMGNAGFRVVGDPGTLFNVSREVLAAEYRVGAVITDIKGNICQVSDIWDGLPRDEFTAEFYVKVEWQVYSVFTREVVKKYETEGYGLNEEPLLQGTGLAFNRAFAAAAEHLAANADFQSMMLGEEEIASESPGAFDWIELSGAEPSKTKMARWQRGVAESVVRVRGGVGHGSGFVISDKGYILTNYHVVGESERATVIFENNVEVIGDVVRRHKIRDIALIKVPLGNLMPLPIGQSSALRETDEVFAIGAPLDEKLHSTVSKGIVSAFRIKEVTRQPLIQSDVDIHGGNSGGPLTDADGNVVGVSVSGYSMGNQASIGLNFFIPIDDALKKLKITLRPTKRLKRHLM